MLTNTRSIVRAKELFAWYAGLADKVIGSTPDGPGNSLRRRWKSWRGHKMAEKQDSANLAIRHEARAGTDAAQSENAQADAAESGSPGLEGNGERAGRAERVDCSLRTRAEREAENANQAIFW